MVGGAGGSPDSSPAQGLPTYHYLSAVCLPACLTIVHPQAGPQAPLSPAHHDPSVLKKWLIRMIHHLAELDSRYIITHTHRHGHDDRGVVVRSSRKLGAGAVVGEFLVWLIIPPPPPPPAPQALLLPVRLTPSSPTTHHSMTSFWGWTPTHAISRVCVG